VEEALHQQGQEELQERAKDKALVLQQVMDHRHLAWVRDQELLNLKVGLPEFQALESVVQCIFNS
jgi:hypothetical protein